MTKLAKFAKVLSILLVFAMCFSLFAACTGGENPGVPSGGTKVKDNETDRLVLSIGELDGVFNPYFASSATDISIIGLTQISMLSSDKDGNPAYGEDEACVVLDYEVQTDERGSSNSKDWITTYKFVLKNDVKFSDGSPLTIRDVLFNLYVYLDPAYAGSSTLYSTDIVGLDAYRTQTRNENAWDSFEDTYAAKGWDRIVRLNQIVQKVYDDATGLVTDAQVMKALDDVVTMNEGFIEQDPENAEEYKQFLTVKEDYERAKTLFKEELQSAYNMSKGTAEDIKFDEDRQWLHSDQEAFLWNQGLIYWDEKANNGRGELKYDVGGPASNPACRNWSEEQTIQLVYDSYVENGTKTKNMTEVTTYWQTSSTLQAEFTAKAKEDFFANQERIKNIEGITFANMNNSVTVKGKTYAPVKYVDNDYAKGVKEGNEVLQIQINGVDPTAIWNFGFTVAPMYYYSDTEHISKFDFVSNFGVEFSSIDFMNNVVKNPDKIGLPVGAGPYKATTASGSGTPTASSFRSNNVCYYERNEYFMFPAKIKYVNYQVVDQKMMLQALESGDIDFAEPNAQKENIDEINAHKDEGFAHDIVLTNGYGYIGINAEKVPNIHVRRAIMHAINTQLCLDYYPGFSQRINRPMTKAFINYYPFDTDTKLADDGVTELTGSASQYYSYDATGELSRAELEKAGFSWTADGKIIPPSGETTKYTFTIAGDSEEHPAFMAMNQAKKILEKLGFSITVQKDINALKKLNTGDLTVWAAAWGSGVDPDMYQVYHIDSQAGSTNNWGYRAIRRQKDTKYKEEWRIVNELSDKIDAARETLVVKTRAELYHDCLDLVMELAVELPAYQRSDMFAYNTNVIDRSTLTPAADLTPLNGPLARIWEVSFAGND